MTDVFNPKEQANALKELRKGYNRFNDFQMCLYLSLTSDNKLLHEKLEEFYTLAKLILGDNVVKHRTLVEFNEQSKNQAHLSWEKLHEFEKQLGLE